eukprot:13813680-Heterocapsa_arctica.AAC.1
MTPSRSARKKRSPQQQLTSKGSEARQAQWEKRNKAARRVSAEPRSSSTTARTSWPTWNRRRRTGAS